MRQLIAGNWKMNGLDADLSELTEMAALKGHGGACDILVCPPATLIAKAALAAQGAFAIGGQDCRAEPSGAFTGDISAEMLKDAGAVMVIVGHSERRHYYGESDTAVAAKAAAAWRAGLKAIVCVGETQQQREAGAAHSICHTQVTGSVPPGATAANMVLAYEPVWAIGTGQTATAEDIVDMHVHLRQSLIGHLGEAGRGIAILYGGSVKPSNAREILALPEVGGALVGGASLKAGDFLAIIGACKV